MKLFLIFLIPFLVSSANATPLRTDWPRLTQSNSEVCSQALILAQAVNATSGSITLGAKSLPAKLKKEIKLYPAEDDISAGSGYLASAPVVSEDLDSELDGAHRTLYLTSREGLHFAVYETPFNWRGNFYSLYLLQGEAGYTEFKKYLQSSREEPLKSVSIKMLNDNSWIPFWFWQPESSPMLAIAPDYKSWTIFGPNSANPLLCKISFFPTDKDGDTPLPRQMKQLNQILLQIIGTDGPYSGTMHPVGSIRFSLASTLWPNLLYRPHTFEGESEPYNTRQEVESGLREWAAAPAERDLLQNLKLIYPKAEAELAKYYQKHFEMDSITAKETAKRNLDILFLTSFTFHKEDM